MNRPPLPGLRRLLAAALLLLATAARATAPERPADDDAVQALPFAGGFELPWSLGFLPDGRVLVTERPGRLRLVSADGRRVSPPLRGLPPVDHRDHGGLLDVSVDPAFASNRRIFFSYTAKDPLAPTRNTLTVARARLSDDGRRLRQVRVLFRQSPAVASGENLGGRLAVSAAGHLFVTVGDRREAGERVLAQSLAHHHGKTIRLHADGRIPADNPFTGRPGALAGIWTLGHRNPQGAFIHPRTGELWVAEHGPFGGDEINIARRGGNHGWPLVTHGCEYDGCAPIGVGTAAEGMTPPLAWWGRPGIAPSNLLIYTGTRLPQWRGDLFVGSLAGMALWRLRLGGTDDAPRVLQREALFAELGERIRDVKQAPDGTLHLLTDGGNARILRVDRRPAAH